MCMPTLSHVGVEREKDQETQGVADVALSQKAELCLPAGRAFPKISK